MPEGILESFFAKYLQTAGRFKLSRTAPSTCDSFFDV